MMDEGVKSEMKWSRLLLALLFFACVATGVSRAEPLHWKPGEKGSQLIWHAWPDKISAGPARFDAKEFKRTEDGFVMDVRNQYADVQYSATIVDSEPNDRKRPCRLDSAPESLSIDGDISDVAPGGKSFTGVFPFAGTTYTCRVERTRYEITHQPLPDERDMRYGPHFRHTIDFYRAESDRPTPLVVFMHPGGWIYFQKGQVKHTDYLELTDHGVSVASINFRFKPEKLEPRIRAPFLDAGRAVQYLRSKAKELNIDKDRVAAVGAVSGGTTALWLALHDDLADPDSSDPVARESSRLQCAAGYLPYTTFDPVQIKEWVPQSPLGPFVFARFRFTPQLEGKTVDEFLERRTEWMKKGWIQEYSPAALVTPDDPPIYMDYGSGRVESSGDGTVTVDIPGGGRDGNLMQWEHLPVLPTEKGTTKRFRFSPVFGLEMKKICQQAGVQAFVKAQGHRPEPYHDITEFLLGELEAGKE
ncbi:MAG: alpha/beta hydrolase [Candidatus Brocadiia bacterium]